MNNDFLPKHLEEVVGSVFAVITVSAMFEVFLYSAISAFVGAIIGYLARAYIIPIFGRLFKVIRRSILKLFK